ncbi:hypothetical protein DRQ25_12015 [Candidatus Fermentibacteria bacterium]|nr:MAG: hypothetical protein DRQ25_12015 [Candidatus Fermentibacteria bacterium]
MEGEDNINWGVLPTPKIIQHREKLRPTYVPEVLVGRDHQYGKLVKAVLELVEGITILPHMIYGSSGSGKTATMKVLQKETHRRTNKNVVYVNARTLKTPVLIYTQLMKELGLPTKIGLGIPTYLNNIAEYVTDNPTLFIIDEIDGIIDSSGAKELYPFIRFNEIYPNVPGGNFGFMFATNNMDVQIAISSFTDYKGYLEEVRFDAYGVEEIYHILHQRVREALIPKTFDEKVLHNLSEKIFYQHNSNLRHGLQIFALSCDEAEKKRRDSVSREDVLIAEEEHMLSELRKQMYTEPIITLFVIRAITQSIIEDGGIDRPDLYFLLNPKNKESNYAIPEQYATGSDTYLNRQIYSVVRDLEKQFMVHLKQKNVYKTDKITWCSSSDPKEVLELTKKIMEEKKLVTTHS